MDTMTASTTADKQAMPPEYAFPGEDEFGFAGMLRRNYWTNRAETARIWLLACELVEHAFKETNRRVVRDFLRSGYGRHLADDLSFRMGREPVEADIRKALETTDWSRWRPSYDIVASVSRKRT